MKLGLRGALASLRASVRNSSIRDTGAVRSSVRPELTRKLLRWSMSWLEHPTRMRISLTVSPPYGRLSSSSTPLQLNMEIEELDALAGKEATVRAQWRLSVANNAASQTGTRTARQPLQSTGIDDLVLAWSRALADISSALAASIQTHARANMSRK
jgi:ABC-type transport auxiliary lipoprotein component